MSTTTEDGDAGSSEGNLDDQRFFTDADVISIPYNEQAGNPRVSNLCTIFLTNQLGGIVIRRLPPTAMPFIPAKIPLSFKERPPLSRMLL